MRDRPRSRLGWPPHTDTRLLQLLSIALWQRKGHSLKWTSKELHDSTGYALERKIAAAPAPMGAEGGAGAVAASTGVAR